jgi:hypothetical protein
MYQLVDSTYRLVHVFKYFFKYEKSKFSISRFSVLSTIQLFKDLFEKEIFSDFF